MKGKGKREKVKKRKGKEDYRWYFTMLGRVIRSIQPILRDAFMEGKHSWIELKESNYVFKRLPFGVSVLHILSTTT